MSLPIVTVIDGQGQTQIVNTLPNSGQATMANSLPVAIASDQTALPISSQNLASLATAIGNPSDPMATDYVGSWSLISLSKAILAALGGVSPTVPSGQALKFNVRTNSQYIPVLLRQF